MVNRGVKLLRLGQTGPRDSRPPISDPKVPMCSTRLRTHVLQVWSKSTVGLLTIARLHGYCNPNPRVGSSGGSETPFYDPSNPT
ncbi:unnamed protein product [Prunus armeniaca]